MKMVKVYLPVGIVVMKKVTLYIYVHHSSPDIQKERDRGEIYFILYIPKF